MLSFGADSVGEERGVGRGQRTGEVTKDGSEACAHIIGLRGIPSQNTCFKQKDDGDDCFATK